MSVSTVLAKALFDNAAESPEELAFRKGDILMVLEQEQAGGPGWWLCSLHGRQGIAPANRLRLLQTAATPGSDICCGSSEDSVYLSPGSALARVGVSCSAEDIDGVYRSPLAMGEGRPGELRRTDGGRPRSHSSSGTRPRPDWDIGVNSRPRSPSLRGRGTDISGTLYQNPAKALPAAQHVKQPGSILASESVYLTPSGVSRPSDDSQDNTYLVPRDTVNDDCYLVPKGTPLAGEDVYQTPTGGVNTNGSSVASCLQPKVGHGAPGFYQAPNPVTTSQNTHQSPVQSAPKCQLKGAPSIAIGRGKPGIVIQRGSPLLVRAAQGRRPGSPNSVRKPPPPAPPVRSVTRKDLQQSSSPPVDSSAAKILCQQVKNKQNVVPIQEDGIGNGKEKSINALNIKEQVLDKPDIISDQVYDTPPSGRWQRTTHSSVSEDDGIYDTPRSVPPHSDSEAEVYDVPTHALAVCTSEVQQTASGPEDSDDGVYSVPSLPGIPLGQEGSCSKILPGEHLHGASEKQASSGDSSEPDCGIYDMPALTVDVLQLSTSSTSTSTRRLSVSSNGSGDVQWKTCLSNLVHSLLATVSCSPSTLPSRDLATSLAEILSTWKASHCGDPPPPLQQAWARLADLLPALSAIGTAPPSDDLLTLVKNSLDESSLLLQVQSRPRLPSQESLSRRPLPALPVAEGITAGVGMGPRKGSWIQERPLPPTPHPKFPIVPSQSQVTVTVGSSDGEDDPSNEYAGIGLTPIRPPIHTGDSVGYVKLQGKPDLSPNALAENGHTINAETRMTPSPPLPVSLSLEDSELLAFYSSQSLAHLSCLADAIDVLFSSIQGNQPPRIFVARGKSLIVTAHKLVFIGDTLSRLLSSSDLRTKITTSGGSLCQALKAVVVATKGAAQNYPSLSATQEMVDCVAELSQHAAGFSTLLQRLAEIS
ncbi:unnamed protein product [Knipowitschia caucasica]